LQGPAPRLSRAIGLIVAVTLVASEVGGCAHTGPAPAQAAAIRIDTNTPQGLRAKQTVDMINSDWPIGTVTVGTLASPKLVEAVTGAMDRLWWDRPINVTGIDVGAGSATLHVLNSYSVAQDIELRTNDAGLVDRFQVTLVKPRIGRWQDVDAELTKSGAHYSYQVSKVDDGKCTTVAGTRVDESLPLASIFKLYVLLAVADAVNAGTLRWTDQLTITKEAKVVGSAGFDEFQPGARVSVRDAAQQMISASDNMATDMLIDQLGPGAVDDALVAAGHHDPAAMRPFPTAHELFSVGWGKPDVREEWKRATTPQRRATLLEETKTRPYEPDPERTHTPASPYGAEWYGSAMDVCRVHAALQAAAAGPAAPVRDILSATPGIDLDESKWTYIAAKGGNLPGDLTFSWYAEDHTGQAWVVSFQLNWPSYRSLTAASWLLSIATQSFGLASVG
jgi:beta-lactamase class A